MKRLDCTAPIAPIASRTGWTDDDDDETQPFIFSAGMDGGEILPQTLYISPPRGEIFCS